MKWYAKNGLKILYDAEYGGDYLVNKKYGLSYGFSDKARGNSVDILADTANSNRPNSRVQCKTLEFFVTFIDGNNNDSLFYQWGDGDIDDTNQADKDENDYYAYWWTKEDDYNSQYIFSAYPLILFKNTQTEQSTDYIPLVASFIVKSSDESNLSYPKLWMQLPIENSYDSVNFDGIEIGSCKGSPYRGKASFMGRLSSSEEADMIQNEGWSGPTGWLRYRGFNDCNLNLANNGYIINGAYATNPDHPVTFYGMTISIVIDISEDEENYGEYIGTLTIYCNGNIICQLDENDLGLDNGWMNDHMILPRYIANQTQSERYGWWQFYTERDDRLSQPLFVRAYDRVLSTAEIQNNTDVDHQRFIGDMDMEWINGNPPPEGFSSEEQEEPGSSLDW